MIRTVCLLICLCCFFTFVHAQEVTVDTAVAVPDTSYTDEDADENVNDADTALFVSTWNFPSDSIRSYLKQKDFTYIRNLDSLLKARQEEEKLNSKKSKPVNISPLFTFIRILLWAIAIGVVLFVVYRLFLSEHGLFTSPARNKKIELEEEPVTDAEYLAQKLNDAIKAGNYRLAVRYMYLQSLSKIAEKGWLLLSPDKTNYQYVRELAKPHLKNDFSRITLLYDYVWYGDFSVGQQVFGEIKKEFDQFQTTIKQA